VTSQSAWAGRILVTSAGRDSAGGHDGVLVFDAERATVGAFSDDPRIVDPRGMSVDRSGELIYVNTADRLLALDRDGRVARDSGPMTDLDPGGAVAGPDGRLYVTARRRGTIFGVSATLDGTPEPLLPEGVVPFPRGFAFGRDERLYLASGIGPSGEGDNTIVVFDRNMHAPPRALVTDPQLSPLDLTFTLSGNLVVASESPFGAEEAVVTIREYDPATGDLIRVFAPDPAVGFSRPRGLRVGPDGHLYCVGETHVIAFDLSTGEFMGPVVQLERLHGQALVLLGDRGGREE
jgi:DNA-binding beta-propeller fold protein YncE